MASALDKLTAAKNSLTGDQINLTVCKATNHDILSPKRKHVDVLLSWSNNPNLSIPDLADRLFTRVADTNWVVVFKAMIVGHELMAKGGERFIQNLASRSTNFNVTAFLDKGNIVGYDMSPFIRRYGHYLNEKALAYRAIGYDFCRLKKTDSGTELRTMDQAKLQKTLPVLQKLLDALVDFSVQQGELANGIINTAFLLLFKDLVKLFACYNDGIINLLEKFFDLKKPAAKDSLDLYKKFLVRMEKVSEFLKVAENLGISRDELPDLSKAPSSLLTALENHVQTMDKRPAGASPTRSGIAGPSNVKVGSLVLPASTAAALGMPQDAAAQQPQTSPSIPPPGQSANQQQALAEKKRQLEAERERLLALKAGNSTASSTTAAAAPATASSNLMDDFASLSFGGAATAVAAVGAFQHSVPHTAVGADLYAQPMRTQQPVMAAQPQTSNPFGAPAASSNNPFGAAGNDLFTASAAPTLAAAPSSEAPLGDILVPQVLGEFGTKEAPKPAGLGKDLDSSLNIAAESLTLGNGGLPLRKQQQFQPQVSTVRTGGSNWSPMQQSSTVTPGPTVAAPSWGAQPGMQPGMGQPAMVGGAMYGGVQPAMGGMQPMGAAPGVMGGYGMAAQPGFGMAAQQPMGGFPQQPQQQGLGTMQDPFGPVPGTQGRF